MWSLASCFDTRIQDYEIAGSERETDVLNSIGAERILLRPRTTPIDHSFRLQKFQAPLSAAGHLHRAVDCESARCNDVRRPWHARKKTYRRGVAAARPWSCGLAGIL